MDMKKGEIMNKYKHTQIGYLLIGALGLGILVSGYLNVVTSFNPVILVVLFLLLVCLGIFASLTVEVNDYMLKLQFGLGIIQKVFQLKDIDSFCTVRNPWYYGWGIHFFGSGWLYNVSGWSAIELKMKSGEKYRIGTDDLTGLARAIDIHLQKV
jgi:hypothetical protein